MTLTDEQKKQQPLLEELGIILAPEEINYDGYLGLTWALILGRSLHPEKALALHCCGVGGDVGYALAIVDLIQEDGNMDGIAIGRASSGHSVVWAACPRRYVYPNARIGVHQVRTGEWNNNQTERDYQLSSGRYEWINKRLIATYTAASNKNEDYWREIVYGAGIELKDFDADDLLGLGMAKPISERGDGKVSVQIDNTIRVSEDADIDVLTEQAVGILTENHGYLDRIG